MDSWDGVSDWQGVSAKDFRALPHKGKYTFFKDRVWVTEHAAQKTTLHVLKPADAKLYYTDGKTWSHGPSDRTFLRHATRLVTLAGCKSNTAFAGGILVKKPRCVTLSVVAHGKKTAHRHVKVPLGKHC